MTTFPLIFLAPDQAQPAPILRGLPDLKIVRSIEELQQNAENASLIFIQALGELRGTAVKLLVRMKKNFALTGLGDWDLNHGEWYRTTAKKKHLQIGWLGSLRFHQAVARMKELITGGTLGTFQSCKITFPEKLPVADYVLEDCIAWILPQEISTERTTSGKDFVLEIQGEAGWGRLTLTENLLGIFEKQILNFASIKHCFNNFSAENERNVLLLSAEQNRPWRLLQLPIVSPTTHGNNLD